MAGRFRLLLIGVAALGLLAVGWVVSVLVFKASADLAVAVASALVIIFFGVVAAAPAKSAAAQADIAGARERLREVVNDQIAEQATALTARGVMAVPWTRTGEHLHTRSSVADLARAVAAGRQLIILGSSQSGKTTLATRLAETLAGRPGAQPVLFSLSTWNPDQIRLNDWMLQAIQTAYGLSSDTDAEAAEAVLRQGMSIPVFDGLDEIPDGLRASAADTIHRLIGTSPAVLTSIDSSQNERLTRVALPSADVIRLTPVTSAEVSRYLIGTAPSADDTSPLGTLAAAITAEPDSPASEALSSPLIAWLAKTIYDADLAPARSSTVASADQLLDPALFPDAASIETHLLRSLPAAVFQRYRSSPRAKGSPASAVTPGQAERWLRFLADRATNRIIGFWEFRRYAPLFPVALAAAAVLGCAIAVVGTVAPYLAGPGYCLLLAGAVFGFGWSRGYSDTRDRIEDPTRIGYGYTGQQHDGDLSLHGLRFLRALATAAIAYAAGVITDAGLRHLDWLFGLSARDFGILAAVATVLCYGIANLGGRIAGWILMHRPQIDARMGARAGDPLAAISSDFKSGCAIFAVATVTLAAGLAVYDVVLLPADAIVNVCLVPVSAIIAAFIWNEWICFKSAHLWLVARGRLPLQLSDFLSQCHDGGILRKNGNHFEFRHRRLQESLQTTSTVASGP